ncbi:SAM-dependent methyltransferase [Actinoplanes sp. NBC_00393]|uniref:SAM-dependent methyltransferase n=1 Tax=Actinoplanes sp. NBC_00393 TaxID=2975953 RepID=UPI002E23699F
MDVASDPADEDGGNSRDGVASDEASDEGVRQITLRSPNEIARFFAGWKVLEPGVVSCSQWRPGAVDETSVEVDEFGGIAVLGDSR